MRPLSSIIWENFRAKMNSMFMCTWNRKKNNREEDYINEVKSLVIGRYIVPPPTSPHKSQKGAEKNLRALNKRTSSWPLYPWKNRRGDLQNFANSWQDVRPFLFHST